MEITPEREYLIAMESFDDAVEVGAASVDDRVIDEGLLMIRRMWGVGLAHGDVKPANLMVHDGHLRLIDSSSSRRFAIFDPRRPPRA